MKINKIFHTLYFMVMMLPLFIIPIFAININQKSVEPISIEVQENQVINFNQLTSTNFSIEEQSKNGLLVEKNNNFIHVYGTSTSETYFAFINEPTISNHIIVSKYNIPSISGQYRIGNFNNGSSITNTEIASRYQSNGRCAYALQVYNGQTIDITFTYMTFDLTLMYGQGKEPQLNTFLATFNLPYYEYNEGEKMMIQNPSPTIYDDTDIGSQFLYSLYKPVNDYFNFSNYFGLNGIYDWFQMNWFNGTAPLSFFIFYNLMIYWLIISLLWLLFDVLIYVPLLIHRWLDKASVS